ncbi:hypothetical protein BGZ58_004822 [Dissophora ornata]|nr:hypothetical protein BGZ58_004822 [Dissophora ornata]
MEEMEAKEQHLHALNIGVYKRETAVTKVHTKDVLRHYDEATSNDYKHKRTIPTTEEPCQSEGSSNGHSRAFVKSSSSAMDEARKNGGDFSKEGRHEVQQELGMVATSDTTADEDQMSTTPTQFPTIASRQVMGSPPHTEDSKTVQLEHTVRHIPANSAPTAPMKSPCTAPDTAMESVQAGHKHPRDCFDDSDTVQMKQPRNGASPLLEDRSQNKEHKDYCNGDDNGVLPDDRPASFDQAEDAMSDEVVLLSDGDKPEQSASFDQAEGAKSNNNALPHDLPVQRALLNQVQCNRIKCGRLGWG